MNKNKKGQKSNNVAGGKKRYEPPRMIKEGNLRLLVSSGCPK